MIGYLCGKIAEVERRDNKLILLTAGGVGYLVNVPAPLAIGVIAGNELKLHCHLVVRDDALDLYGFGEQSQREIFLRLIKINGVGPRIALIMVAMLTVDDLLQAVASKDIKLLTKIPGVGPKLAQRLLLELGNVVTSLAPDMRQSTAILPSAAQESIAALVKLGYDESKAAQVVKDLDPKGLTTEQLLKKALKLLFIA